MNPDRQQHSGHIVGHLLDAVGPGGLVTLPTSSRIEYDDLALGRQVLGDVGEQPGIGAKTRDQHHRCTGSVHLVVQGDVADPGVGHR